MLYRYTRWGALLGKGAGSSASGCMVCVCVCVLPRALARSLHLQLSPVTMGVSIQGQPVGGLTPSPSSLTCIRDMLAVPTTSPVLLLTAARHTNLRCLSHEASWRLGCVGRVVVC